MQESGHIPVLPDEIQALLDPSEASVIVDLTAGRGGHAALLASIAGPSATVVLFDLDAENLSFASRRVEALGNRVHAVHENFATVEAAMTDLRLRADCVLADLGFASNQVDAPERGLSFRKNGPLDMRLNPQYGRTAADLIATCSEEELADLIYHYGEEPYSRRIARKIAQEKQKEPILETAQLAQLVRSAYGARARSSRLHPATRTFMALRIAVNDELQALDALLDAVKLGCRTVNDGGWLNEDAKVAVMSFHSLEDRRVKHSFVDLEKHGLATRVTRKPICASEEEIAHNPRSRPAKLRAIRVSHDA